MADSLAVLVMGGGGFMGARTARALGAAGHRVSVLTRGLQPLPDGVAPLVADRLDAESLARALDGRRFDLTVDFLAFDRDDIERLLLLPHAALGRYVMISSGQVYLVAEGSRAPHVEAMADAKLTPEPARDSPDHAEWSYGVGKRRAELAVFALRATHGLRGLVLRIPIVQGTGDPSLRLWAWIERVLDGGPLLLPDGGTRLVRHVLADDVARAAVWLADHAPPERAVYNLAQPEMLTLREWLENLMRMIGSVRPIVPMDWDALLASGLESNFAPYAGRWASVPDPTRLQQEWGFEPTPMNVYLPEVVRQHLEHRPTASHRGYAQRALELELAGRFMK
ncbi:MAG: NAD-dependent epimerase/dehydratase family protein [Candidatus Eisenbacteria bacterium]|uniref:NAD-dependent epimerase/dehydratase family protein n=1 Tax=Eiseniibacteriota bacterium TaxID=2212470 RepID=A0A849SH34_UNCEI|nr:NAD-dependent epimerase/dehydratase family protein [Candidatus Eisenbacteria bacterium]